MSATPFVLLHGLPAALRAVHQITAAIAAISAIAALGCRSPDPIDIAFFYLEACPACETYQKAEEIGRIINELDRRYRHISGTVRSMMNPGAAEEMRVALKGLEVDGPISEPLLIVGNEVFTRYEEIEERVRAIAESLTRR